MRIPTYIVDAFTAEPFAGNPAAVCLLASADSVPDAAKQKIAAEMNLSETAFVWPQDDDVAGSHSSSSAFGLRWFTPTTEVPLCGHATLATAAAIFFEKGNKSETLSFETKSGVLTAKRIRDDMIELELPANPPDVAVDLTADQPVKELVGMVVGKGAKVEEVRLSPTTKKLLVRVAEDFDVAGMPAPPFEAMTSVDTGARVKGVIVTSKGKGPNATSGAVDFRSRYFAPWVGIPEDPVTGSAHTVLGPYWKAALANGRLSAWQCSPRGGRMELDVGHERIRAAGRATVVLEGCLRL